MKHRSCTPNLTARRYRSVAVASMEPPLTEARLQRHLAGREAYRRTELVVVRAGGETALVRVEKALQGSRGPDPLDPDPLFVPIVSVEVVATAQECAFVVDPSVDTAVPTQMARAAARVRAEAPGVRCVVVLGRYEHVNFILDPAPVEIAVVEVVPPRPAKLVDQLERVLETAEDLPPVVLRPQLVDLVAGRPPGRWLFPCRGSGAAPEGSVVSYLDERPPREDWTLVGCARSREIHRWFYGDLPPGVELCPRQLASDAGVDRPTIVKCCLRETGVVREGMLVTVPWGASLAEVLAGLRAAVAVASEAQTARAGWAPA